MARLYCARLVTSCRRMICLGKRLRKYSVILLRFQDAVDVYQECRRTTERYHNIRLVFPFEDDDGVWDFSGELYERALRGAVGRMSEVRPEGTIHIKGIELPVPFWPGTILRISWRKGKAIPMWFASSAGDWLIEKRRRRKRIVRLTQENAYSQPTNGAGK